MRRLPPNYHSLEYGGVPPPTPIWLWPGYMMLPFIRAPLGYQMISPIRIAWFAFGLYCCQFLADRWWNDGETSVYLQTFNVFYVIVAFARWLPRWEHQGRYGEPHTTEAGYSWL